MDLGAAVQEGIIMTLAEAVVDLEKVSGVGADLAAAMEVIKN